ncbi:hypothetical protein EJ05DRAFT_504927 [Pseudovirgaria hyperparasitica]|uniref:Uncharacterized protein n=1 Tax=Pseudovirgaria hyperparasitica TaxID=470096 RepID=A0A6A6VU59_9PEZI|nr:uncharacterized protein EJ05DRAFT_504927 [Pseudovirgaria hyperparasitica]KAF2753274.1 hypothetical protein EJ05DRAFT_504927 [Pseudovirgaria hyperparasitica]
MASAASMTALWSLITLLFFTSTTTSVRITRPTYFQTLAPSSSSSTDSTHLLKRLTGDAKTGVALGVVCGVFAIVSLIVAYTGIMYNRKKKAKAKARQLEIENGIAMETDGRGEQAALGDQMPPVYQQTVNQAALGTTKGIDVSKIRPSRTG